MQIVEQYCIKNLGIYFKISFVGKRWVWGRSPPAAEGGKILGLIKPPLK